MALQTSLCLLLVKGSLISASGFTTTPQKRSSMAYVNIYLLAACTSIIALLMLQMIRGAASLDENS